MRWHSLLTITGILAYSGDRRFTADGSAARPADLPVCEQHITDNRNSGVTIGWTGWTMSRGPQVPGAPEFQTKKYIFGNTVQI